MTTIHEPVTAPKGPQLGTRIPATAPNRTTITNRLLSGAGSFNSGSYANDPRKAATAPMNLLADFNALAKRWGSRLIENTHARTWLMGHFDPVEPGSILR